MTDNDWRTFLRGTFQDWNPHARKDELKRGLCDLAWELAAVLAFIGFMAWLAFLPHGGAL